MNRPLERTELESLGVPFPAPGSKKMSVADRLRRAVGFPVQTPESVTVPAKLSVPARLRRWADVIDAWAKTRKAHVVRLPARHGLEYAPVEMLPDIRWPGSPMELAYNDPILRADGLGGDSMKHSMDYFEVTQMDLHGFACDCHSQNRADIAAKFLRNRAAGLEAH